MGNDLKGGDEILTDYFERLRTDEKISKELREKLNELWNQNKLKTKTHISNALDAMREQQTNE